MEKCFKEMLEKAKECAEWTREKDNFGLLYNYDCDGICSGAIIAKALEREEKQVKPMALKQVYSDTIKEIRELGENYIFVDFGSGQLEMLQKNLGENFLVIDHHQPESVQHPLQFNPMLFGYNGSFEISSAGACYLFAKEMGKKNYDSAALAVVGAVGDMQDSEGKLDGLNREILEEGMENGLLEKKIDLRLYGRISRPLAQFLAYSTFPTIPELTGNEANCARFLNELGIALKQNEQWRSYEDLLPEEKKRLSSALILHIHSHNVPEWKIRELIGEVYTIKKEHPKSPLRDAKEFGTLCNDCGRWQEAETALRVCGGDRKEYYEKALSLLVKHRNELRQGILLMRENGVQEMEGFYFFDAKEQINESIIGIVAGMLYGSGTIGTNKPIIAFATSSDGTIKVSARATRELVRNGLNLGKAIKETCKELGEGADGGGHSIASGAKILAEQREKFLEIVNKKMFHSLPKKTNDF